MPKKTPSEEILYCKAEDSIEQNLTNQQFGGMASVTILASDWLIGVSILLVLALLAIRTPKKERMLIERFGQQCRE